MNKEKSEQISSQIGLCIANEVPVIAYTPKKLKQAKKACTPEIVAAMEAVGIPADKLINEDFELLYVMLEFCKRIPMLSHANEQRPTVNTSSLCTSTLYTPKDECQPYVKKLFEQARKFSMDWFYNNPYMKTIQIPTVQEEDYLLTTATYDPGEIFQYDMPNLAADMVVPSLGFFTGRVRFPSLYEGVYPWMSVCPSEIFSMQDGIDKAHGRVLVLGLGLGYYPFMAALKENVTCITIVELEPIVIRMFEEHILPQFSPTQREKIHVIRAEAISFMDTVKKGDYDFCFADIWENQIDGAQAYIKLKPHEDRLGGPGGTQFSYWIEEAIRWQLTQNQEK